MLEDSPMDINQEKLYEVYTHREEKKMLSLLIHLRNILLTLKLYQIILILFMMLLQIYLK